MIDTRIEGPHTNVAHRSSNDMPPKFTAEAA